MKANETSIKFKYALSAALANPGHDYPEDFEHENGMYMSVCIRTDCRQKFTGGKYRFICNKCSSSTPSQPVSQGLR
jgi:hypothetical protein